VANHLLGDSELGEAHALQQLTQLGLLEGEA
jgi:hypothetical protein